MKITIIILLSVLSSLTGCVSMPGFVTTNVSQFDGTREIHMNPGWVCNDALYLSCPIKLGLSKNTKMMPDEIILTAEVEGTYAFAHGISLHFNIDGEITSFESIDTMTKFRASRGVHLPGSFFAGRYTPGYYSPPTSWSSKGYRIDKTFLKKLIDGKSVAVKIDLSQREYVEGVLSDSFEHAKPGFADFYHRVFIDGELTKN